jgi:hypothetical protein
MRTSAIKKGAVMITNIKQIKGFKLGALDGDIGSVKDFYFDDESWTVRYLVADTGKWLPGRQVLISPFALQHVRMEDEIIDVSLTKKQIEDSPSIDTHKPVSRQYEIDYYQYYGWPHYWEGPALWGVAPTPAHFSPDGGVVEPMPLSRERKGDPHLRSAQEMMGYHIQARDGEVGHVEDFLIEDENWAIRYLVVDTKNWWPGKNVLVAPQWIQRVSWQESKVFVDLTRETIKSAPEFVRGESIDRVFEGRLYRHYNRPVYWAHETHEELAHAG